MGGRSLFVALETTARPRWMIQMLGPVLGATPYATPVARDDVEEKLLEGWGVATRALIDDLTLEHVRGTERVRQHRAQDVNVAEFRRQTRAYDVVAVAITSTHSPER